MQKVVFYGGAFDPVHTGHIQIARRVFSLIAPDNLYFVPLSRSVHKPQPLFDAEKRVLFLESALADEPGLEIYLDEIHRQGPSYTVETLRRFLEKNSEQKEKIKLYYIIGSDEYYDLENWKEPEKIIAMADLIVVNRPGAELPEDPRPKMGKKEQYIFVKNIQLDISSSELRRYIQQKQWQKAAELIPYDINLLKENIAL